MELSLTIMGLSKFKYLNAYNDVLLFAILIPIINTINYHLTYSTIRWDWYTYTTYAIDTIQGYIAWLLIRWIIVIMDKKMPYWKSISKRILYQIIMTNIVAQGFIIGATVIINAIATDKPLPTKFYTYNLFIFFIWILVINGIYIALYFHNQWRKTAYLRDYEKKLRSLGFEVRLGNKVEMIPFDQVTALFVEDGTTYLKTKNSKSHIIDSPLNKLMSKLPEELFFKLNRKYIVHRDHIDNYKKGVNGKIIVHTKNLGDIEDDIIVSRITAPQFKRWFSMTSHSD